MATINDFNSQPREGGWFMQRRSIVVFVYFNSQPREGGWLRVTIRLATINDFNSQPREGGWSPFAHTSIQVRVFQLTAARRRLVADKIGGFNVESISTHSRAKAAGAYRMSSCERLKNFNSQPREGGWRSKSSVLCSRINFNSQPREGGWENDVRNKRSYDISTHSRAKAAG